MLKKLYIEPTTKCNLNCKMCFRHTWFEESFCYMSMEDYRHVRRIFLPWRLPLLYKRGF